MTTRPAHYRGADRRRATGRRVPSVFVAHGSPNTVFDREFGLAVRRFAARQGQLDAAVVVSAHWKSLRPIRVTRTARPDLLYDFSGLPARLDLLSYPCRGSVAVADHVIALLEGAGMKVVADPARGLDHGTWVPMSLAFPSARVPIVQVSLPAPAEPDEIVEMGRALAPLRERNVMIFGSGGVVHNLHRLRFSGETHVPDGWALVFDEWVRERVAAVDMDALRGYRRLAPHSLESVPTAEHFEPLLLVMGTWKPGDRIHPLYDGFRYGSLSMQSFAVAGRRHDERLGLDR